MKNTYDNYEVLRFSEVLDYCDGVQVMTVRDEFDTLYLCLLYADEPVPQYTAVRISHKALQQLKNAEIDLLSAFAPQNSSNVYYDVAIKDDQIIKHNHPIHNLNADRLPDPGYYLQGYESEKITVTLPKSDKAFFRSLMHRFGWIAM